MPIRTAQAEWHGPLREGHGHLGFGNGAYEGSYSWNSRFASGRGTNPEELIAAAHAACYSMALAGDLGDAGFKPTAVSTSAKVHINPAPAGGWDITAIDLSCVATVPDIDDATFQRIAEGTRTGCPVSKALRSVTINLVARLA